VVMTFRRILPMLAAFAVVLAGCASAPSAPGSAGAAPSAAAPAGLVPVSVTVPDGLAAAPLDEPRQVLVPSGWTMSVFARVPSARLAA
jgi:ABC-type glycerol-3-phosphate transport system substrate-binding protein